MSASQKVRDAAERIDVYRRSLRNEYRKGEMFPYSADDDLALSEFEADVDFVVSAVLMSTPWCEVAQECVLAMARREMDAGNFRPLPPVTPEELRKVADEIERGLK